MDSLITLGGGIITGSLATFYAISVIMKREKK